MCSMNGAQTCCQRLHFWEGCTPYLYEPYDAMKMMSTVYDLDTPTPAGVLGI